MRKIVAIFAHPDDEAFGPAGTLAKFAQEGHEVYILCATSGEEGENHITNKTKKQTHEIRRDELRKSARILGVKKVYFLGFIDGTLSNNNYHILAKKIRTHLNKIKPDTILTFEHRGVSGHIDHIVVSMVSTFLFHKLKYVKKIMYYARKFDKIRDSKQDYFVYFPPGYKDSEIDLTVNTQKYWNTKVEAMKQHKTQLKDMNRILQQYAKEGRTKEEHFLVTKK